MDQDTEFLLTLNKDQLLSLFAILRRESRLNSSLTALFNQLETLIYPLVSIEELENLDQILS